MSYFHFDIFTKQSSKKLGNPCGDVIDFVRDELSTTIVLSDGIGSGIKANIAANMCVSRLLALIKNGATLREAFTAMVRTMNKAWGTTEPFAVFAVAQILNNGETTILSYEIPSPLLITRNSASVLSDRVYTLEKAIISEVNCSLELGQGLLMVCDGITQAGMGNGLINGWEIEGVASYASKSLDKTFKDPELLINSIHDKAREYWGKEKGDDCSLVYAKSRRGIIVNIMSGPLEDKSQDTFFVARFLSSEGIKIVCGGSTAKILARETGKNLTVESMPDNGITPPKYSINGINLVTEGIVTLNQVYNILDEDLSNYDTKKTPVIELVEFLKDADRINFFIGNARNIGSGNIEFRQQGILSRQNIIPLIADKLRLMGKLVVIN